MFWWHHMVGDLLCLGKYGRLLACLWKETTSVTQRVLFCAPQKVFFVKNKFSCFLRFLRFFYIFVLLFCKFFETNRDCRLHIAHWSFVAVFMTVLVLSASIAPEHRSNLLFLNLCASEVKGIPSSYVRKGWERPWRLCQTLWSLMFQIRRNLNSLTATSDLFVAVKVRCAMSWMWSRMAQWRAWWFWWWVVGRGGGDGRSPRGWEVGGGGRSRQKDQEKADTAERDVGNAFLAQTV